VRVSLSSEHNSNSSARYASLTCWAPIHYQWLNTNFPADGFDGIALNHRGQDVHVISDNILNICVTEFHADSDNSKHPETPSQSFPNDRGFSVTTHRRILNCKFQSFADGFKFYPDTWDTRRDTVCISISKQ